MAANRQSRMLRPNIRHGALDRLRSRPQEKHPIAFPFCQLDQQRHNVSAGHPFTKRVPKESRRPNQRRSVTKHEMRVKKNPAQFDIVLGLDDKIHIGRHRVMRPPRGDHSLDNVQGFQRC